MFGKMDFSIMTPNPENVFFVNLSSDLRLNYIGNLHRGKFDRCKLNIFKRKLNEK